MEETNNNTNVEIIEKVYKIESIVIATIFASKHGWIITYSDKSSHKKNIDDTIENNFNDALKTLKLSIEFSLNESSITFLLYHRFGHI
jgi:hypothetical protein